MNVVVLMGRLTKDADVRYSAGDSQSAVARMNLAVNRKTGDEADFINLVAFGRQAEFFERFGKKGTKFTVRGRIQTGSFTDKDGKRIYTTDVIVEDVEFAESKKTSEN